MASTLFENYRSKLIGLPVSHVWRGYGSSFFLEIGTLSSTTARDGLAGQPEGQYGVMIEWSWRIEDRTSIICGSWSDEKLWYDTFTRLVGKTIEDVSIFGRLPELAIHLSGDLHVVSFMTTDGQPEWTLFDRCSVPSTWLHVENGEIREGIHSEDTDVMPDPLFQNYRGELIGKTTGEAWRGHGSIFLECVEPDAVMRRDGLTGQLLGHYTVMIEGRWNIRDGESLICNSTSDDDAWKDASGRLAKREIRDVNLSEDFSELTVCLAGGLQLISETAVGAEPGWRIFDRRSVPGEEIWIKVRKGAIHEHR